MPELPEVETVRRLLSKSLAQSRIVDVVVREPRLRWRLCADTLSAALTGATFVGVRRRAKYLLADLVQATGTKQTLAVHLGMTGWWGVRQGPLWTHDHVSLALADGRVLAFNDARRFGSMHLIAPEQEAQHRLFAHLGCEPLDAKQFTAECLYAASRGRQATIKERLMDARCVVGVGNIYASEALYLARIHPRLPAGKLSLLRAGRLVAAVQQTLSDAIALGGTTFRDFRGSDGAVGKFTARLQVYGRDRLPCGSCGHPIKKAVLGGRSTFFCTQCQRR